MKRTGAETGWVSLGARTLNEEAHSAHGKRSDRRPRARLVPVREPRDGHDDEERDRVRRHREELRAEPRETEALHDCGREERDAREGDRVRDPRRVVQIEAPLHERRPRLCPRNACVAEGRDPVQACRRECALIRGEPVYALGVVSIEEEDERSEKDGWCALDDEEPPPCLKPTRTVELTDPESDRASEPAAQGCACQDKCDAECALVGLVPECQAIDKSGEETCFEDAEKKACREEPGVVACCCRSSS